MFSNDIGTIITTSLLRNINSVQGSSNTLLNSNSSTSSFDTILNSLGSVSNSSCCSCNRGTSSSDILSLVTAMMGNSSSSLDGVTTVLSSSSTDLLGNVTNNIINIIASEDVSCVTGNSENSKMDKAISLLKEQVGKPYVWGANGPDSFDCSGLTKYIYKEALGIDIPRVSYDQAKFGKAVDKKDLQVGDLVFFDTMNKGRVSHVGIYIGNNEFIHASNKRDGVKLSKLDGYYEKTYRGARRP